MLSSLILHKNKPFLHRIVACDKKWILYDKLATTSSVVGSGRSSKALPKAELVPKKIMVTGGLLLFWSTTAFWIPAKPLHLRSMLSKSMSYTENCNARSWHWSTERAQFFSVTTPDRMSHNQRFKSWTLQKLNERATKFGLICHIYLTSCQPTTTSSSILITFCSKNAFITRTTQKMLSKSSSNPKAWIFLLQQ